MAYSKLGIINLALGRIGQPKIDSLGEDSEAAIQADLVWEYLVNEVLESEDWFFAKTRVALTKNDVTPVQGYDYAYTLPSDFLRLCRQREEDPTVYPNGALTTNLLFGQLDIQGTKYNYVIETIEDGTVCLFTSYDNSTEDLVIQYIRRISDVTKFSAHFCSTLGYRIAADLAVVLTESVNKSEKMMGMYGTFLKLAKSHNKSGDYLPDETGNNDWENAGR